MRRFVRLHFYPCVMLPVGDCSHFSFCLGFWTDSLDYPSQAMSTCTLTDLCRVLCTETSGLTAFIANPQLSGLLQFPLQTDPWLVGFLHLLLALGSQTLNFLPQVSLCLGRLPQLLLLGHPQEFQLLEEEILDINIIVRYCVPGISTSIINDCKVAFFFLLHNL